jgi:GNAT superfamily N-acetyltransferase
VQIILKPRSDMSQAEIREFWDLEDIVYPNGFDGPAELEGVVWADPEWDICVRDDAGQLVSHAGILERDASFDDQPVSIAGLAEMLTHPAYRRQGYGGAALREAARFMRAELQSPFALLVCPLTAIPFYSAHGWQRFNGTIKAEVEVGMAAFGESAWMVLPVTATAPVDGDLDLQGIPW